MKRKAPETSPTKKAKFVYKDNDVKPLLDDSSDKMRNLVRTKVSVILANRSQELKESCKKSTRLEKVLHEKKGPSSSTEYKSQFKALRFNLNDSKNDWFWNEVWSGRIAFEKAVGMTSKEMASIEKKEERDAERKEGKRKATIPQPEASKGMFTCGKCKSDLVTYTELQTRSADEPATIFAACTKCGNRWKQ